MELSIANFARRTTGVMASLRAARRSTVAYINILHKLLLRLLLAAVAWGMLAHASNADMNYIEGMSVPTSVNGTRCAGLNVEDNQGECIFNYTAADTGQVRWENEWPDNGRPPQPVTFPVGGGQHSIMMQHGNAIAPVTGVYTLTTHICESLVQGTNLNSCTIAAAVDVIHGRRTMQLTGGELIGTHDVKGGDKKVSVRGAVSICYTLDTNGHQYKLPPLIYCGDGEPVPDHPESCHLDGGTQLNVPLGAVRRSDVPLVGHAGAGVSKTIGVTCSGDSALDTVTTFKYTALSGEPSAVATSTDGLGIAVDYNGAPIGSGQEVPGSFASGANTITLNFTPVRSTTVPASQIATGDFTSDLVMIITIQ